LWNSQLRKIVRTIAALDPLTKHPANV
jgi:hypothetical protein